MPAIPLFLDETRVPVRLAGLDFTGVEVFTDPRWGARLCYAADPVRAEGHLYTLGLENLEDDLRTQQAVDLFRHACGDVASAEEEGRYLDLEVHVSQYLHIPSDSTEPFCLWAAFGYRPAAGTPSASEGRLTSHLTLRIDRGHVNTVRYSYPAERDEQELPRFLRFLVEWTAGIRALP